MQNGLNSRSRALSALLLLATALAFGRADQNRDLRPRDAEDRSTSSPEARRHSQRYPPTPSLAENRNTSAADAVPFPLPSDALRAQDGPPKPPGVVERVRKAVAGRTRRPVEKTNEVLLFLAEGADPHDVGRDHGLRPLHAIPGGTRHWVFSAPTPQAAERARSQAAGDPRVAGAFMNSTLDLTYAFDPSND